MNGSGKYCKLTKNTNSYRQHFCGRGRNDISDREKEREGKVQRKPNIDTIGSPI